MDIIGIDKIYIRTQSSLGAFDKVFKEELTITKNGIEFKHTNMNPLVEPTEWKFTSNSEIFEHHFFLFKMFLLNEIQTEKKHEFKEFFHFRIECSIKNKIVFREFYQGSLDMNGLHAANTALKRLVPECVLPIYILMDKDAYEEARVEFGEFASDEENLEA